MKYSHVAAIAMKDMKEAFSSLSIYGPMIGIPLFFAIVLPIFTVYISQYAGAALFTKVLGVSVASVSAYAAQGKFIFVSFFSIDILGPDLPHHADNNGNGNSRRQLCWREGEEDG